jgi:hypothetical protein
MMKRAREVYWIVNYLQDIRADFFAIYHIPDWDYLDGPLFISLVERLPLYEGALQNRIRLENAENDGNDIQTDRINTTFTSEPSDFTPGQTLSMSEALSGDSKLLAMNEESQKHGWGDLFEMKTG